MKYTTLFTVIACLTILASCGWSENQKSAARTSIGDGFTKGLSSSGSTVDEKVKDAWVDCIIDKASEKMTFDEFSAGGTELKALQDECAEEVGLMDAITVE